MGTRIEKDFLGQKELGDDVYYGVQTLRGKENFHITGIPMSLEPEFVKAFGYVKKAAAMANSDLGVLDAAAAYVRGCGLLSLKVAKAAVTGAVITPFRAVFIEVEYTPALREFREKLRDIGGARELIPPHISLLYTIDATTQMPRSDFDAERLKGIAARCASEIEDTHFTLGRPVVNSAGGDETNVRGWKVIRKL